MVSVGAVSPWFPRHGADPFLTPPGGLGKEIPRWINQPTNDFACVSHLFPPPPPISSPPLESVIPLPPTDRQTPHYSHTTRLSPSAPPPPPDDTLVLEVVISDRDELQNCKCSVQ
jgi:hypothetical protein